MERVLKITIILAIAFSLAMSASPVAWAQGAPPPADGTNTAGGPRKQLATIIFAGLGGAILGLSTLSFYGRPQDKLSNIAIGFAFGVISGTAYVTFKAAKDPAELYGFTKPQIDINQNNLLARSSVETAPFRFAYEF